MGAEESKFSSSGPETNSSSVMKKQQDGSFLSLEDSVNLENALEAGTLRPRGTASGSATSLDMKEEEMDKNNKTPMKAKETEPSTTPTKTTKALDPDWLDNADYWVSFPSIDGEVTGKTLSRSSGEMNSPDKSQVVTEQLEQKVVIGEDTKQEKTADQDEAGDGKGTSLVAHDDAKEPHKDDDTQKRQPSPTKRKPMTAILIQMCL